MRNVKVQTMRRFKSVLKEYIQHQVRLVNEEQPSKPHWKLNSMEIQSYNNALEILKSQPQYLKKSDDLVDKMTQGYNRPMDVRGLEYNGDIFYDDLFRRVDGMGAFSTSRQRQIKDAIETYVYSKLKLGGFYIHS